MKNKVLLAVGIFLILMGASFCGIYRIIIKNFEDFKENANITTGVIVDINHENQEAIITYKDNNGKEYRVYSNFYSNSMKNGDKIKVYYKKTNPAKFEVDISSLTKIFDYVFYGVGGLLILIGSILILIVIKTNIKYKKLLQDGFRINATITDVVCNKMININGKHPYIIRASFKYNDLLYEVKSTYLWFNAEDVINTYGIKEIPVCINQNNPKEYVLDVSELKQRIGN